jgi:acetoin utilization deacetylase AcuC-like enzyme
MSVDPSPRPSAAFISHADCGRHDTGWNHPEHVGRLRAITRALRNEVDLFHSVEHLEGRHATVEELALAHDPRYIESVHLAAVTGGRRLDPDTVTSEGSWDAARAATGCVLDAVDLAINGQIPRSFCAVRPPGHHALHDRAMGFCLFGNVAIGAHYARKTLGCQRVLIADWDVHHGNGTQALVQDDPNIHFCSMHQWPWYPGTGAAEDTGPHRNVWNVPMPGHLPASLYVHTFEQLFDAAIARFVPDLIFISAGFDSLKDDPLGEFTLEPEDIGHLTRFVMDRADSLCGGRVVSVLEGGYAPDRVAEAAVVHLRTLAGLSSSR